MGNKKRIRVGPGPGGEIEGTRVAVTGQQEYWNTYLLEDGSKIRLKVVVKDILRIDGEYDPEGNPLYVLKSQQVLDVDSPDDLQRQPTR